MPVQPDTEIMQGGLGRQPGLKAVQLVWALPVQPEGMVELVKDCLHYLAYPSQPSAQCFGPGIPAVALGGTDYPSSIVVSPPLCRRLAFKAFVHYIAAPGWLPQSGQPGMGSMPEGEEVLGQGLVFDTGWGKAEAGDDALRIDRKQQVEAFIPAQPVAPANVNLPGQPTSTPAFGGPGGNAGTVQGFRRGIDVLAASPPGGGRKPPGSGSGAGSTG